MNTTFWPDSKENEGSFLNIQFDNFGCSISSIIFNEEEQAFYVEKNVYWLGENSPSDEEKAQAIIQIDKKIVDIIDRLIS